MMQTSEAQIAVGRQHRGSPYVQLSRQIKQAPATTGGDPVHRRLTDVPAR